MKEEGLSLSKAESFNFSPFEAWRHYIEEENNLSVGIAVISTDECESEFVESKIELDDDPKRKWHATLRYESIQSNKDKNDRATELRNRSWDRGLILFEPSPIIFFRNPEVAIPFDPANVFEEELQKALRKL